VTIVLVTGAGGGLGCALVEKMLDDGFDVVCQYRDHYTALKDVWDRHAHITSDPIRNFDSRCFKAELTNESDVRNLRAAIESTTGQRVQHLINLAGASSNGMCWKLDLKSFTGAIYDNLVSTFLVCREFIPGMRDAEYGRIINISSVVAANGAVGASHYAAAKAGIEGFTRSAALELIGKGVTVNALALGYFDQGIINTIPPAIQEQIKEKIPAKKFGSIQHFYSAVKFLLDSDNGYTTGQTLHVDGGLRL
jgi:NAD(P)-dependent dehydrogenase (short-subunit alcohol dehydrogenase family)